MLYDNEPKEKESIFAFCLQNRFTFFISLGCEFIRKNICNNALSVH